MSLIIVVGLLLAVLFELHTLVKTKREQIDLQQWVQRENITGRSVYAKSEELLDFLTYLQADFAPYAGRFKRVNWFRQHLLGQQWMYRWGPHEKWQPADPQIEETINIQLQAITNLQRRLVYESTNAK